MRTERVYLDGIETMERMRPLHADRVAAIKSSIEEIGLRTPPTVMAKPDGDDTRMILVTGHHRIEALRELGHDATDCFVIDDDEIDAKLWEIDENLIRAELSPTEEAEHLAKRKELWEARRLQSETKVPIESKREDGRGHRADGFASDTAKKTGQTKQAINKKIARANDVIEEVRNFIRGTKLDTGTYLDKIKNLPPNEQVAAVKRDLAALLQQQKAKPAQTSKTSKIDADVKSRAAKEVAEIIAEHVPGDWWDAVKSNLYAAGAKNIANELTNITGQSVMDRRYA